MTETIVFTVLFSGGLFISYRLGYRRGWMDGFQVAENVWKPLVIEINNKWKKGFEQSVNEIIQRVK